MARGSSNLQGVGQSAPRGARVVSRCAKSTVEAKFKLFSPLLVSTCQTSFVEHILGVYRRGMLLGSLWVI